MRLILFSKKLIGYVYIPIGIYNADYTQPAAICALQVAYSIASHGGLEKYFCTRGLKSTVVRPRSTSKKPAVLAILPL